MCARGHHAARNAGSSDRGARIGAQGEMALDGLSLAALALYEETKRQLKPTMRYRLQYIPAEGRARTSSTRHSSRSRWRLPGRVTSAECRAPSSISRSSPRRHDVAELVPLVPTAMIPEGRHPYGTGASRRSGHGERAPRGHDDGAERRKRTSRSRRSRSASRDSPRVSRE